MNILIIDDSRAVHAFLKACFASAGPGVRLIQAYNGEEGFRAWRDSAHKIDLILLDWEMPVLDGPSTVKKIVAELSAPPIVMMTTRNAPSDIAMVLGLGVKEYILKPFTADILAEKIETVVGRQVLRVA